MAYGPYRAEMKTLDVLREVDRIMSHVPYWVPIDILRSDPTHIAYGYRSHSRVQFQPGVSNTRRRKRS